VATPFTIKYLHKYLFKRHDQAVAEVMMNEIEKYIDAHYCGPLEASWKTLAFPMHNEFPNVERLLVHLPSTSSLTLLYIGQTNSLFTSDMHVVTFNEDDTLGAIAECGANKITYLTAFFIACMKFPEATADLTYQNFSKNMVWKQKEKRWQPWQRGTAYSCIVFVSPLAGK
jgi:hypothetical protein